MRILLNTPTRKLVLLAVCLAFAFLFFVLSIREFAASYYASKLDLPSLQRAVQLSSGNSDYRYKLGRYFWALNSWRDAEHSYQTAVSLNPHRARYWLDLAATHRVLGDANAQKIEIERAITAAPTTPDIAWEAANFYLVQGDIAKFLQESRIVLASNVSLGPATLNLCWRVRPDAEMFLRELLPARADSHIAFLDLLLSKQESVAAARTWARIVELDQPVEKQHIFEYLRYLLAHKEVDQARAVWQQSAHLSNLSAYQPSAENLIINSDFTLDIQNGGFDWTYVKKPDMELALDPSQAHSGNQSLAITFDRARIEDAGIQQLIPVEPNTQYEFSGYFKAQNIEGAGGPSFALADAYDGTQYFLSDELKDADFWKQAGGSFVTGPQTKLLVLRVARVPAGNPIKGKLWISDLNLAKRRAQ